MVWCAGGYKSEWCGGGNESEWCGVVVGMRVNCLPPELPLYKAICSSELQDAVASCDQD